MAWMHGAGPGVTALLTAVHSRGIRAAAFAFRRVRCVWGPMSLLLPLGLVFLMFVVGLRLEPGALTACFARPRALAAGLAAQIVALPALAAALAHLFALDAPLAAGLVVVAAAPGGITSNYAAALARADVALSTAMTLTTSLLAFATLPLALRLTGIGAAASAGDGLAAMSAATAAACALPLAAGLATRRRAPAFAARVGAPLDRAARLVFAAIVLATFWLNRVALSDHAATLGPAVVALNLGGIAAAALIAALARLSSAQRRAAMMETGLQNVAMALFVADKAFGGGAVAIPALLYAVAMNAAALALIAAGRRDRG